MIPGDFPIEIILYVSHQALYFKHKFKIEGNQLNFQGFILHKYADEHKEQIFWEGHKNLDIT